jgi:PKD repeat protein
VSFTCSVTGGVGPYTYLWDFKDGSTSTLQNPEHTYDSAGTYNVSVTVADSAGNSTQKTIEIEVTTGGGTSSLPIAIGGIVVAVAVAAILALLLTRRKGKTAPAVPSPTVLEPPPPTG